ncbi:MAG TPA: prolyl oligopeptidase family serine peptidase, partial [Mycobacterium sp.]
DATKQNLDVVAFVTAVVNDIPGVDRQRMSAAGLSNGGMMAYTMACRTDLFAAIGVVAATMFDPCPDPRPTSVMHIHGLVDNLVKFNGTPKGDPATVDGPPIRDVNAFWRRGGQLRAARGHQEPEADHLGRQVSRQPGGRAGHGRRPGTQVAELGH